MTPAGPRPFAVFDIDGTLIRWQLYHSIVSKLANRELLQADADQAIRDARMLWKNRDNPDSFKDYEHVIVHTYNDAVTDLSVDSYLEIVDMVFDEYKNQVYRYTRDLIKELKDKGYLLFAISGSQHEIVAKLADYYGFDAAIGARYEIVDNKFTGKLESPALGKAKYLEELLAKYNVTMQGSVAVGDSESDEALLTAVENPIAFNPSAGLYEIAKANGWKIVIERKNVVVELIQQNGAYVLNESTTQ